MMFMKKTLTIIILIMIMTTGTLAYAGDFNDIKDTKYEEAVEFLSAFDVINGFGDGTFRPEEPVTRGQMAKMLTVVLGYKDFSQNLHSSFADTQGHWADPYVEIVNSFDIVVGYDEDTFGPDNNISYSEAVTMIVRTLGYTDSSLEGDWPYDYLVKATDLGILDDVSMMSSGATRGDVALMIYNALDNYQVRVNDRNRIILLDDTLLDNIGTIEEDIDINYEFIEENQDNSNIDLEEYRFHTGDLYYNNEENIVHIGNFTTDEYKGTVTSLSSNLIFVRSPGGNVDPFVIDNNVEIIFNKDTGRYTSLINAKVRVVYEERENYNRDVIGIVGEKVTSTSLASSSYKEGSTVFSNVNIPTTSGQADLDKVEVWGDVNSILDIKSNDFLYFYESDRTPNYINHLGIEVVRQNVEGTIRATSSNDTTGYSYINGTRYDHSPYYQPVDNFGPGYYARAYLDKEGRVVKYNLLEYLLEPDTYGLVLSTQEGNHATLPRVTVLGKDGSQITYGVPLDSDLIVEIDEFNFVTYSLNLSKGDIVKYSINGGDNIEEIIKKDTEEFEGIYREKTGELDNLNRYINSNSIVYYENGGTWKTISSSQISEIVSGQIITSSLNNSVEVFILEEGLKTNFENHIYAPILNIEETIDGQGDSIYKFILNISGRERALYTENDNINVEGLVNTFVKINISDNRISTVEMVNTEIEEKEIQGIYKTTLVKIDGTYWEFSENCNVYTAEKDSDGNLIFTGYIPLEDLQTGDIVNIYDLEGNFDGVIDHVILVK
jgi:hypothetical protein